MENNFRPQLRGLFLYGDLKMVHIDRFGISVPNFGDSFYIILLLVFLSGNLTLISVPNFGDSFYILDRPRRGRINGVFPSPTSGTLFI